ncbi:MAG TPA: hypothetical protein VIW67_17365 [Terriglobales bacterium]
MMLTAKPSSRQLNGHLLEVVIIDAHGSIHDTHTTLTKFGNYLIIPDGLPIHGSSSDLEFSGSSLSAELPADRQRPRVT